MLVLLRLVWKDISAKQSFLGKESMSLLAMLIKTEKQGNWGDQYALIHVTQPFFEASGHQGQLKNILD